MEPKEVELQNNDLEDSSLVDISLVDNSYKIIFYNDDQFKDYFNEIKKLLENDKITFKNVFNYVCNIIQIVDNLYLSSVDKYSLVAETVYITITNTQDDFLNMVDLSDSNKNLLKQITPNFIEVVLKLSKDPFKKKSENKVKLDIEATSKSIYDTIKTTMLRDNISTKDFATLYVTIVMAIMGMLEELNYLSGDEKKTITKNILKYIIEDQSIIGNVEKEVLKSTMDLAEPLITSIKDVANGEFDINKAINSVEKEDIKALSSCCMNISILFGRYINKNKNNKK